MRPSLRFIPLLTAGTALMVLVVPSFSHAVSPSYYNCVVKADTEIRIGGTEQLIVEGTAFEFGMGDAIAGHQNDGAWFAEVTFSFDGMSNDVPAALKFSLASGAEVPMTHIFFDEFGRDVAALDLASVDALISMPIHCNSVDWIY